jgi:hypothetical protein
MQDVTYYVQTKAGGEKTTILEGLQGFFEPGKVTALVRTTSQNPPIDSVGKCHDAFLLACTSSLAMPELSAVGSFPLRVAVVCVSHVQYAT